MIKKGLGKGLDSLFNVYGTNIDDIENLENEKKKDSKVIKMPKQPLILDKIDGELVKQVKIGDIDPNAAQPRKRFDEEALNDLAQSIKTHGIIQPLVVVQKNDRYMIIAGERRWRAAKIAQLSTVPVMVRNYTEKEINEISIIENLQREDLNPMEAARAMKKLMDDFGWTQEVVAERLGKSRSVIANTIRLINLEPEVIELIEQGKISAGHARSLVVVTNRNAQLKLAKQVMEKKLTVRDLESAVKTQKPGNAHKSKDDDQSIEMKELITNMQRVFGTKVSAVGSEQRGRIYIDYFSKDDLERIYELIEKLQK